jgi:hypothetical protein
LRSIAARTCRPDEVEELADAELDAKLVKDPARGGRRIGEQHIRVHERKVANEDRRAFSESPRLTAPRRSVVLVDEPAVDRRETAPLYRSVHHVVMNEGKGVQELEGRAGIDDERVRRVSPGPDECPRTKRRPEAFSVSSNELA